MIDIDVQLGPLKTHLAEYRHSVDHLFSTGLKTPAKWRAAFSRISLCVAQLYLDYLVVTKLLNAIHPAPTSGSYPEQSSAHIEAEKTLRQRLRTHLDTSPTFSLFDPADSMFELIGLKSRQDYVNSFFLHLPEMYGESLNIEHHLRSFQKDRNGWAHAKILIGLKHLSRNHALFVQPALEEAANETSWHRVPILRKRSSSPTNLSS